MNNLHTSPQFLRKRKFFMALPLLCLPFMTLMFWALGGGAGTATAQGQKGINATLPDAQLKEGDPLDKMAYYDQAAQDSAELSEQRKNDPFYHSSDFEAAFNTPFSHDSTDDPFRSYGGLSTRTSAFNDANEQRVYSKLDQLNAAIAQNQAIATPAYEEQPPYYNRGNNNGVSSADVDRLEQMMQTMTQRSEPDPEMQQLNGMLEKIIEVQNPGLVQEKLKKASEQRRGFVYAVNSSKVPDSVSTLGRKRLATRLNGGNNGFFSFDNASGDIPDGQNSVQAVIHENQTLVNGSTVKLRLTNDIYINGTLIPRETFVFGLASLNGERLNIKISNIRYKSNLFPVDLSVFDIDGLDGIYIPGAISREVAKESADRGLQNIGFNTIDPSIGMQAAGVGIEAAKTLFSKKAKLVRVTVKAGYQVLLRDEKQKQEQ